MMKIFVIWCALVVVVIALPSKTSNTNPWYKRILSFGSSKKVPKSEAGSPNVTENVNDSTLETYFDPTKPIDSVPNISELATQFPKSETNESSSSIDEPMAKSPLKEVESPNTLEDVIDVNTRSLALNDLEKQYTDHFGFGEYIDEFLRFSMSLN